MIKAIYYSKKMKKYYFSNTTVFGNYYAETVYGVEQLKTEDLEIKTDKNGKLYFLGEVILTMAKNGNKYYKCIGPAPKKEKVESAEALAALVENVENGESKSAE